MRNALGMRQQERQQLPGQKQPSQARRLQLLPSGYATSCFLPPLERYRVVWIKSRIDSHRGCQIVIALCLVFLVPIVRACSVSECYHVEMLACRSLKRTSRMVTFHVWSEDATRWLSRAWNPAPEELLRSRAPRSFERLRMCGRNWQSRLNLNGEIFVSCRTI